MNIIKQPPAIHTAFNPVVLQLSTTDPDELFNEYVRVYLRANGKSVLLERELFNNITTFNLSGPLKRLFDEGLYPTIPEAGYLEREGILSFVYDIDIDVREGFVNIPGLLALNAVSQIGYSSDLTTLGQKFLTGFGKLKKYEGYPLSVAFLNPEKNSYINFNGVTINPEGAVTDPHFVISIPDEANSVSVSGVSLIEPLVTNFGWDITTNSDEQIYVRINTSGIPVMNIPVDHPCLPDSPFYVRWISRTGGWEYWMFSFRQSVEKEAASPMFAYPYILDQSTVKSDSNLIGMEGSEKITAGAQIGNDEFDVISGIIYSPRIEWYNKEAGKWIILTVDSSSIAKDTREESQSIEITFLLPTPQLQF